MSCDNIKSDAEHDQVYEQAADLVAPYLVLHETEPKRADTDEAQQELRQAIGMFEEVLQYKSDNWAALWIMGKAHQALGESANACDAFHRAFGLNRDNPDVARELVLECMNLGRTGEAVAAAEHAVSLKPDDSGLLANLALAYLLNSDLDRAIETGDDALRIDPQDPITKNVMQTIWAVRAGELDQPTRLADLE